MTTQELAEHELFDKIPIFIMIDENLKVRFKPIFQKRCSKIYAEIESLSLNGPTCSCASKVREFVSNNKLKVAETVLSFFEHEGLSIEDFISSIDSESTPESLSGKIVKTTVKKWPEFAEEIQGYSFHSFSVVKEGDNLLVFFL